MLSALTAASLAITASVFGAALPASAAGTASISGTVSSSLGAGPVENVRVELFSDDGSGLISPVTSVTTAANGTYALTNLPAGLYTLEFEPLDDEHLVTWLGGTSNPNDAVRLELDEGEVVSDLSEVLQRAGSITGTVTDSVSGLPVEGVDVRGQLSIEGGLRAATDVTSADGTFQLVALAPGSAWEVSFDGTAFGYLFEYYDGLPPEAGATPVSVVEGQQNSGVDATLNLGASLSGTVELAANPGVGYEGASIDVIDEFGNARSTLTDASGGYVVDGLAVGPYTVRASNVDGVLTEWWNNAFDVTSADIVTIAQPGATMTGIDFSLDVGGSITGIVTGPTGEALSNVYVLASPVTPGPALFAITDSGGAYELVNAAPVEYLMYFEIVDSINVRSQYFPGVDRFVDAELVTGQAGATVTDISVQLPAGAIVSGTVTADGSGTRLPGIEVEVWSDSLDIEREVTTDVDGEWSVQGIPTADDYRVRFRDFSGDYIGEFYDDQRFRADATPITLITNTTVTGVNAALDESATLSGRVVDNEGNGVPDAEIVLAPDGSLTNDPPSAFTDQNGDFEVRSVRPGDYRVLIGELFSGDQQQRSEWFENAYTALESDTITLAAGENRTAFDVELLPIEPDPEYPTAPSITVDDSITDGGIEITLPTSGVAAYGAFTSLNFGPFGDSFLMSPFDDGFWGYAQEGAGADGEALVMTQSLGANGFGPAVRELVEIGAPPGYPVRPDVAITGADGTSVDVTWSIPETGDGIESWTWDIYSVDQPGEPFLQSGFAVADEPFTHSEVIGGLEPKTQYELFVIGSAPTGEQTYWGRAMLSTSAGPAVLGFTQTPTPIVTGGPRLGGTLTAVTGAWAPAPVALQAQWLRDGFAIPGANALTYAPVADDLGAEISVRVTASKTGYLTQSRTSAPTAPVVDLGEADSSRLDGPDRYATAVEISQAAYGPGVPVVYLATGTGFPDALSAASAAASLHGPLLVTLPTSIPTVIKDELVRLDPQRVVIVGGTGVVSEAVQSAVEELLPSADVERQFGADRYATSRNIAINAFTPGETPTAFIATGRNFPDALAASAAAGSKGAPVILVNGMATALDTATRDLLATLDVDRVVIAGGTSVVSSQIENALRALLGTTNVTRLSGADRYLTAVAINDGSFDSASRVYFATGRDFPDALAGAAVAGAQGAPLYTVPGTCVPRAVLDSMASLGATEFVMLGGRGVLSNSVSSLTTC